MASNANLNLLTNADSNLILTGYTGPNQPAIGRAVAARLGRKLVSFEMRLEDHTGMSMDEIRDIYGQARLKDLENEVVSEIVLVRGAVIRMSSEALAHSDNLTISRDRAGGVLGGGPGRGAASAAFGDGNAVSQPGGARRDAR